MRAFVPLCYRNGNTQKLRVKGDIQSTVEAPVFPRTDHQIVLRAGLPSCSQSLNGYDAGFSSDFPEKKGITNLEIMLPLARGASFQ
jgi:hypothetical protein